jgi:two-component system CheB/CheR fusion protein
MKAGRGERLSDLATSTARDAGPSPILQALKERTLPSLSAPLRYAIAPLGPLFSTLVQYTLLPEPSIAPFVFFYFAVALVSWVAGRGPGLLSVALSALVANYMFMTPHLAWSLSHAALTATALFLIGGGAVSLLCASFRTALLRSRRTAATLRQQADLLHLSHDAIYGWRSGDGIETWNRGAEELYGFTGGEARGRLPRDLLQTVSPTPWERLEAALREQGRWDGELEHRTRDGRTVTVSAKLQLFRGPDGVERILATNRDITERKLAEQALRAKEAELELILNRTPFMLTRCSRDLRYLYASRPYAEMIGRTPDEVAGKPIIEIMGEEGFATIRPHVEAVLRGQRVEWECPVRFKGVGERLLHVVYVPDRDEQGQVIGWVGSMIDVTERRQAQEALRVANARLIEADRRKTEFLAVLSHELRNPLAPIRNGLYILDRAPPGGEQARRAQMIIDRQVNHLARLVDDLLDVMRISRGKAHLQLERLDVADVVSRAGEDHRATFADSGLELEVRAPARPIWIKGDRVRLAQLIGNLLNNAAKFTTRGGQATLSVDEDVRLGQAVIRVWDTGAGIAPEMLPKLFEPFVQADHSLDRSKGGLGLGLALVKGLVEMHDGAVSVASEGLGKGAEFTVRLPLETSPDSGTEVRDVSQRPPPRRVLVIEDNVDAADSLREVLELGGHRVDVAYAAEAGIARARAFKPDVVLCDIGLPGMDGYEVARIMRADPAFQATMLVALTGYATPEDIRRAREAGFHRHLAKPPPYAEIDRILARVASA